MEQDTGSGLGWALAIMTVAAIIVGWMAQSWKRRTGAAWGCGTFLLMIVMFLTQYFILSSRSPHLFKEDSRWIALGISTALIGMVLLALNCNTSAETTMIGLIPLVDSLIEFVCARIIFRATNGSLTFIGNIL